MTDISDARELAKRVVEANQKFPTLEARIREGKRYTEEIHVMTINGLATARIQIPSERDVKDAVRESGVPQSQLNVESNPEAVEKFNASLARKVLLLGNPSELDKVIENLPIAELDRIVNKAIMMSHYGRNLDQELELFRSQRKQP